MKAGYPKELAQLKQGGPLASGNGNAHREITPGHTLQALWKYEY